MPDKYDLSRRKVLAGLGTIGIAGAGAGLGTSALFSDTESFENNRITAGSLDMAVTAEIVAANDYWSEIVGSSETADGDPVTSVDLEDVKPGDWAIICFDFDISSNPGYLQVSTANFTDRENGKTEPEPNDGDGSDGELDEKILATLWGAYDGESGREGLSTLDVTTNNNTEATTESQLTDHSWDPSRQEGGEVEEGIHYTTLREAHENYQDGVVVTNSDGEPRSFESEEEFAPEFCLLLEIPDEVGNEIQTDTVSFDLVFTTEQVRNNPDPFSSS